MQYPINEIFKSLQGEATHAGKPAIFLRLQGCDVGCAWCDTKHTWTVDQGKKIEWEAMTAKQKDSEFWAERTAAQLVSLFDTERFRPVKHVVITGGEPAQYDLVPLINSLVAGGFYAQVETSGTEKINVPAGTWVTVSPKIKMPGRKKVLPESLRRANEIKHPVAIERNVDELLDLLRECGVTRTGNVPIWLQPVWQAPRSREICVEACMKYGFRLSVQTHKVLGLR